MEYSCFKIIHFTEATTLSFKKESTVKDIIEKFNLFHGFPSSIHESKSSQSTAVRKVQGNVVPLKHLFYFLRNQKQAFKLTEETTAGDILKIFKENRLCNDKDQQHILLVGMLVMQIQRPVIKSEDFAKAIQRSNLPYNKICDYIVIPISPDEIGIDKIHLVYTRETKRPVHAGYQFRYKHELYDLLLQMANTKYQQIMIPVLFYNGPFTIRIKCVPDKANGSVPIEATLDNVYETMRVNDLVKLFNQEGQKIEVVRNHAIEKYSTIVAASNSNIADLLPAEYEIPTEAESRETVSLIKNTPHMNIEHFDRLYYMNVEMDRKQQLYHFSFPNNAEIRLRKLHPLYKHVHFHCESCGQNLELLLKNLDTLTCPRCHGATSVKERHQRCPQRYKV